MKKMIKRWLERLGQTNKENFGSDRLDCCTIGREPGKDKNIKTN